MKFISNDMKSFLVRILFAVAITLVVFSLASDGNAQQADEDAAPATPQAKQPSAVQPSAPHQEPAPPQKKTVVTNSSDEQTQDALAFTGRVLAQKGTLVLSDPVTKMIYQVDDQAKVKPYAGKQVKIVGKLEMKSNTIHVDSVELIP